MPEVEDIHRFSGIVIRFAGKSNEECQVWKQLLKVLHHPQALNQKRSLDKRFLDMWYCRNRSEELKNRIADVHDLHGRAPMRPGEFRSAASKLELSLEIRKEIHGDRKSHPDIHSCQPRTFVRGNGQTRQSTGEVRTEPRNAKSDSRPQ